MGKGLRAVVYGLASLLAISAFTLTNLTGTVYASEITNNAYKKQIVEACGQYDDHNNPDVPHACHYGGIGDAGLKYFPQNIKSCESRPGYSDAEKSACAVGAKAGVDAFSSNFSEFSREAFIADVEAACATQNSGGQAYDICVDAGAGSSDSPFPLSPDVCTSHSDDSDRAACNHGVASGNLLMEQFVAIGMQPSAELAIGGTPNSSQPGGGVGSFTPREPVGYDQYGNPIYSDPAVNNPTPGSGTGGGSGGGSDTGGDSGGGGSGDGGSSGDNGSGGSDDSSGTGGGSGDDDQSTGGSSGGNGEGSGTGSGDGSTGGGSGGGSQDGGSTGEGGTPGRPVPDSPHYRPENKGAGMNGPDASLGNAPVGFSEAFYTNGNGDKMKITVHKPDEQASRPGIVFVHGGGWRADGGTWGPDFMTQNNPNGPAANGYLSFRIQYRLMPDGLYYIYHDVRNALEYIQNNAAKFGLDPTRTVMWGDSAGGSLTARVAASGNSGLAAAVTMSGPMNSFRDISWSLPTLAIGLDHTTCIDTGFTSGFNAINNYIGLGHSPESVINSLTSMSPSEQLQLAGQVVADIRGIEEGFSSFDWRGEVAKWGINADDIAEYTTKVPSAANEMEVIQETYTADKLTEDANSSLNSPAQKLSGELSSILRSLGGDLVGMSSPVGSVSESINNIINGIPSDVNGLEDGAATDIASQLASVTSELRSMSTNLENPDGNGPSQGLQGIVSDMQNNRATNPEHFRSVANLEGSNGALQLIAASGLPAEQRQALGYASVALEVIASNGSEGSAFTEVAAAVVNSGDVGSLIANLAGVATGHLQNSQAAIITSQLGKCLDDAIQLAPAVFASPSTPPMFMANAQTEILVPPYDATEMQAKLRSFGTRAEAFIIPGDLHMGYDARAVDPAFNFLNGILHPSPLNSGGGTVSPLP